MNSKGNIVFLGMMGSGKTTIGKLISKRLKLDFFDIDNHIEKSLNMKISEIFLKKGENFFRKFEEKITLSILKKRNIVIALGGGAFLNKKIRDEILTNHTSFWLNLNSKIIIQRVKRSSKRPLALKLTKNELTKLIKKRSNIYSKALYKIACDELTKTEIVSKILNIYEIN
tara:strand:+ start:238 stop:750 length:513 start_codon:yes stop_codon:yes gene_type:complete